MGQAISTCQGIAQTAPSTACPDHLGIQPIVRQVHRDLFGTKDVQNVATASYVWLADQIGHITLGLAPTLLFCWLLQWFAATETWTQRMLVAAEIVLVLAVNLFFLRKEKNDFRETEKNAGHTFKFNANDIDWNIKTALTYNLIGSALALSAFISVTSLAPFICIVVVSTWLALLIAHWWLKRKLAFQQSGAPFLFRLANFSSKLNDAAIEAVTGIANFTSPEVRLSDVLLGCEPSPAKLPLPFRHLLITGPFGAGKSSLAIGIVTEFAFALGLARFLSPTELIESVAIPADTSTSLAHGDGRLLWHLKDCGLVVVDNLDAAVQMPGGGGKVARLVMPDHFERALRCAANGSDTPLQDFATRRSVWVIGDADCGAWSEAISRMMGIAPAAIGIIEVEPPTGRKASSPR